VNKIKRFIICYQYICRISNVITVDIRTYISGHKSIWIVINVKCSKCQKDLYRRTDSDSPVKQYFVSFKIVLFRTPD